MEPTEADDLTEGTPVWIWIVRQRQGQWFPGTVQSVAAWDGRVSVTVRFQCQSLRCNRLRASHFVGITTTQARYVERRELSSSETDRPHPPPPSQFAVS